MNMQRYQLKAGVTWHVEWHDKVTSTNDVARQTGSEGSHRIVIADYQTHGRGQHGRRWHSKPNENILASFVIPSPYGLHGGIRSMAAALCIHNVLQCNTIQSFFKWPNDVLVNGAKIAGVLIEAAPHRLIIGIGINVHWPATRCETENGHVWTSMKAETGRDFDRRSLVCGLAANIAQWYGLSAEKILDAYRQRWVMRNKPVHIRIDNGWLAGIAEEINHDASMRVITHDGFTRNVHSSADIRQVAL